MMAKRKQLWDPGEEGNHKLKPSKNPRLGELPGSPPALKADPCLHAEEPQWGPGPSSQAGGHEESGCEASSSPDADTGAGPKLLWTTGNENGPPPPSQSSAARFVPQFAKPQRTWARPAETRAENPQSPELEPSAGETGSQPAEEEAPGLSDLSGAVEGPGQLQGGPQLPSAAPQVLPELGTPPPATEPTSQALGGEWGLLPSCDAPEKVPDPAATQEGEAPQGSWAQKMEESPACNSASRQPSRSRPLQCAPNDVDKGLPEPEQRTPEEPPLSLGNPGGHPGEAGKEDEPPSHLSGDPPVSPSVRPEISQPESGGAPDLQMGLGAPQMQDAGPQGAVCTPHLPPASPEIKSANISPLSLEPELLHLILSPGTPAPPPDTPPRETGSGQGPPDAPTDWQEPPLDVADMAALWGGSPGQELDFPPDSPMGDAPEGPASETPSEQMPAEGRWGSPTQEQPPTQVRRSPRVEDPVLEDASDIVRGLVVELSNLNRLIMSSQRDLEAFRRLSSRRGSFT